MNLSRVQSSKAPTHQAPVTLTVCHLKRGERRCLAAHCHAKGHRTANAIWIKLIKLMFRETCRHNTQLEQHLQDSVSGIIASLDFRSGLVAGVFKLFLSSRLD